MSMLEVLGKTVRTMSTIEGNIDALIKNIDTVVRMREEMGKDAKDLHESYVVTWAAFDALIENVREYTKAEMALINKNKEDCRPLVAEMLREVCE